MVYPKQGIMRTANRHTNRWIDRQTDYATHHIASSSRILCSQGLVTRSLRILNTSTYHITVRTYKHKYRDKQTPAFQLTYLSISGSDYSLGFSVLQALETIFISALVSHQLVSGGGRGEGGGGRGEGGGREGGGGGGKGGRGRGRREGGKGEGEEGGGRGRGKKEGGRGRGRGKKEGGRGKREGEK